MFKFHEGASVALKSDNALFGLAAGATGTVWAQYDTQPPVYEVTFSVPNSADFDALMHEDELADAVPAQSAVAESQARFPTSV